MAKKRVHELAKQYDMPSAEVLKRLAAAGIEVKAAASAVDEDAADRALTGKPQLQPEGSANGGQPQAGCPHQPGGGTPPPPPPRPPRPRARRPPPPPRRRP